ncbi:MAG: hypothetical protein ABL931_03580 [Usitatibacteraceae bacterium]
MKKTLLVIATGLTLSACASHHSYSHVPKADPSNPRVSVLGGKQIVVDQEPLFFAKGVVNVRINWQLPADSKNTFPKDGITFDRGAVEELVDCRPEKNGLVFSCLNRHTKPGKYKYTIKLDGEPKVAPLDPVLVND